MMNVMAYQNHNMEAFADYMWMGEMDKFDQEMEKELEEQEYIRTCIEQLLDEEEERETVFFQDPNVSKNEFNEYSAATIANGLQEVPNGYRTMNENMHNMSISRNGVKPMPNNEVPCYYHQPVPVQKSTLNPNAAPFVMNPKAAVFVPRFMTAPAPTPTSIATSNTTTRDNNDALPVDGAKSS